MHQNNYYTLSESEQFTFYRVPKVLFKEKQYQLVSAEAKLLYGLLLDRMGLSAKNGWFDDKDAVFIYFTISQVEEALSCGREKAGKLYSELEKAGLVYRKRQGQGKPDKIYVLKFISECGKADIQMSENPASKSLKNSFQDVGISDANNTDINNTDFSNTNLSIHQNGYDEIIRKNIEYNVLILKQPTEKKRIDEIVHLITDTLLSTKDAIRISGNELPVKIVKSRLMSLTCEHIEYVLDSINNCSSDIHNIKAYLLTSLYNAPVTMESFYRGLVDHDLYGDQEKYSDW